MTKLVLDEITSGFNLSKVNQNFRRIQQELQEKVLYRDNPEGEPNQLKKDLDLNGNDILNAKTIFVDGEDVVQQMRDIYNSYLAVTQRITVSPDTPSGGEDGDLWFTVV